MPEYTASLQPTLSTIAAYVGQTATPNQQISCLIGAKNMPNDVFGSITAVQYANQNKYTQAPTAPLNYSAPYANYVWLIGLRGNSNGKMVYARIDIQAKMRFRQTCYDYNREAVWQSTGYQYLRGRYVETGYWFWRYYYTVREWPTTRLDAYANYQIYSVTENNYAKPGYLFNNGTLKFSSPQYNNYGGNFAPFGDYVFKTVALPAGTSYRLYAPSGVNPVAQWDNLDGSFPYDDTFTQVTIGMCANNSASSPTLDNWKAKDI